MRIGDWPLGKKLLASFGLVLTLSTVALVIALWSLSRFSEKVTFIAEVRVEAVKMSARLHRNVMELRSFEKDAILAGSAKEREEALSAVAAVRDDVSERLRAARSLDLADDSLALLDDFQKAYRDYDRNLSRILSLAEGERTPEALELSRGQGLETRTRATDAAMRFTNQQESELDKSQASVNRTAVTMTLVTMALGLSSLLLGIVISLLVGRSLGAGIGRLVELADGIADGRLDSVVVAQSQDEVGQLTVSLGRMQDALLAGRKEEARREWLMTGAARLNEVVLGELGVEALAERVVSELSEYVGAKVGALFVMHEADEGPVLRLLATYAYTQRKNLSNRWKPGEGVVGQALLEKRQILIQKVPDDYIHITSGLGEAPPRNICVTPFLYEGKVRGVVEVGTLEALDEQQLDYMAQAAGTIATAFEMARNRGQLRAQQAELLASNVELQEQARNLEKAQEELQAQQAALQSTNAELEVQMQRIKDSEERLRVQQEELEVTNEELHEKNALLERQKHETEGARRDIAVQAEELALASKYKSEFLANMSHELRTPLNSLLLLARSLKENGEGNLNEDQVESANVIFDSGSDLLSLINEILDLSKIEAGRMDLKLTNVETDSLIQSTVAQFDHMARNQSLTLDVRAAEGAPAEVVTDPTRLRQIIKNLVGNALKFTEVGGVTVTFAPVPPATDLSRSGLHPSDAYGIHVKDTGIGIPADKQRVIFEAFQQADSGDRRRYGGTGLGLSISRELADLLGGEIQLSSEPGVGSTFSLYLPRTKQAADGEPAQRVRQPISPKVSAVLPIAAENARTDLSPTSVTHDDRDTLTGSDRVILIIEDDPRFSKILCGQVHQRGFKVLAALTGEEGLILARKFQPDGIVLDIQLPNMDGWAVLSALKDNVDTRHIPVHIASVEEPSTEGMRIGAIGHVNKPLQKEDIDTVLERLERASATSEKRVLVVEDDPLMRKETVRLIGNGNVKVQEAETGRQALEALRSTNFALVVLDLGLPDMQGLELLKAASAEELPLPPIIVYTVRALTMEEEMALRYYADSIILKDVRSQDRLLDEVALFLHRVVSDLPDDKKKIIRHLHESNDILAGKRVLVVEDDMRTMFAMVKILAAHKVHPLKAENGEKALALLKERLDIDLVLMDMMMPVMDGYEAVRRIRQQDIFANLPIIALTAKAMKEDRQKCINAGASDYLPKPVDQDRLVSLMRVWLCR